MYQDLSTLMIGHELTERTPLVSSLKFFEWQNESYLAIGQSFCSPTTPDSCSCKIPDRFCSNPSSAPATSIVQWDFLRNIFGKMQSVLSANPAHDHHYHCVHEHSMQLNAGAVSRIKFAAMDGVWLLLLASHDKGISCFEWDYEHVVGMRGVEVIAIDTQRQQSTLCIQMKGL